MVGEGDPAGQGSRAGTAHGRRKGHYAAAGVADTDPSGSGSDGQGGGQDPPDRAAADRRLPGRQYPVRCRDRAGDGRKAGQCLRPYAASAAGARTHGAGGHHPCRGAGLCGLCPYSGGPARGHCGAAAPCHRASDHPVRCGRRP